MRPRPLAQSTDSEQAFDKDETLSIQSRRNLDRGGTGMKRNLDLLAGVLLVVGGLNWGLVALAKFDLVAWIFGLDFGETNAATRVIYGLVGLAAVYGATRLPVLARGNDRVARLAPQRRAEHRRAAGFSARSCSRSRRRSRRQPTSMR